jgi:RNA polymerase sigma-70 factor (sigma-E family)
VNLFMTRPLDPLGGEPAAVTPHDGDDAHRTLAALYRERYAPMVRLAHLITGSKAVAPDLVQDAFVKLSRRLDGIDQPSAYLRMIVVNECRAWIRRQAVERKHQPARHEGATLPPDVDEMWGALAELSERQRAALVLRFYEDLSLDDIARTLGCRPGTAKSLVHRGLAALKEVLET